MISQHPEPEILIRGFIAAIRDGRQSRIGVNANNILFPYIPLPRSATAPRGMTLTFEDLMTHDISAIFAGGDVLKHHLLYCHKVALDDPFVHVEMLFHPSSFGRWSIPTERDRLRAELRRYLTGSFTLLMTLRPLIEDEILYFIDPYDYWHTNESASSLLIEVGDYTDWSTITKAGGSGTGMSKPRRAAIDLASTVIASEYHGTNFAMYFPYEGYREIFKHLVKAGFPGLTSARASAESDTIVLGDLLDMSVPAIGELTPHDLASIRRNDELFESWRADLRSAIVSAKTYFRDRQLFDIDAAELEHVRACLLPTALQLQSTISRLEGASVVRREFRKFGVGTIGGSIAGGIPSAATSLGRAIDSYLESRRGRHSVLAAYRHYVAFQIAD